MRSSRVIHVVSCHAEGEVGDVIVGGVAPPPGDTLWELGLDFTVSPGKTGFRGAEEHYRLKGKERFKIWGLQLEGDTPPDNGSPVLRDGRQVGVVTQAMYSPLNNWTVAIARLPVDCANEGTRLTVNSPNAGEIGATTHSLPFYDRNAERNPLKRPIATTAGILLGGAWSAWRTDCPEVAAGVDRPHAPLAEERLERVLADAVARAGEAGGAATVTPATCGAAATGRETKTRCCGGWPGPASMVAPADRTRTRRHAAEDRPRSPDDRPRRRVRRGRRRWRRHR